MKKVILTILLLLFTVISCDSDENKNILPYATVNFHIKPEISDTFLKTVGNMGVYINSNSKANYSSMVASNGAKGVTVISAPRLKEEYIGLGGLLVINTGLEIVGESNYAIYDIACTYEKDGEARIVPVNTIMGRCAKCGSEFQLLEGSGRVSKGPAKDFLQKYRISETERNVFRIIR